jgi:hypothetical protein
MTAPSWYGEPMTDMAGYAAEVVAREGGRVRQDRLLTILSRGFDTRRDAARSWAQDAMDRGTLVMDWDAAGYPYYVAQTADAGSASLLLLASFLPVVLVVVFLAHLLGAMSAAVSA